MQAESEHLTYLFFKIAISPKHNSLIFIAFL